jgi:Ca2+-binding RTX toxin-like protein
MMATVSGSQFVATGYTGQPGFYTSFSGGVESFSTTGQHIISPSGATIDLVSGAYAITDNGIGGDTIGVLGTAKVVGGSGPSVIAAVGDNNTITGGAGNSIISVIGNNETITGGGGADTITASGNNDSVTGGSSGPDLINVIGTGETVTGGGGNDTLNVFGSGDTVFGGAGADTIGLYGDGDAAKGGSGPATIFATGTGDTVTAGSGNETINALGSHFTFDDSSNVYNDTVVGFSQSAGDTIKLSDTGHTVANTALVNGGVDTLITLSDSSTILLKGITHVDTGFFS